MPVQPTYPGVYIQEVPSGVRTIVGVATSITAFIGRAKRGPVNKAIVINNFGDFERHFGGLWVESRLGYAVRDFFINGGSQAIIVRVVRAGVSSDDDVKKLENPVKQIINAAEKAENGKKAKEEAAEKNDDIQEDDAATPDEKYYAMVALSAVDALDDDISQDDIKKLKLDEAIIAQIPALAQLEIPISASNGNGKQKLLELQAMSAGGWGKSLQARVDHNVFSSDTLPRSYQIAGITVDDLFNLAVADAETGETEVFRNVHLKPGPKELGKVLENASQLVRVIAAPASGRPDATDPDPDAAKNAVKSATDAYNNAKKAAEEDPKPENIEAEKKAKKELAEAKSKLALADALPNTPVAIDDKTRWLVPKEIEAGRDGSEITADDILGSQDQKTGLYALEEVDLFNLIYIPPYKELSDTTSGGDIDYASLVPEIERYCEKRRAMLILDSPAGWTDKDEAKQGMRDRATLAQTRNSAIFFPRLYQPNREREGQIESFGAGGTIAGIFARTDAERGVWKAPAGLDATLRGASGLTVKLTDDENGELNPLGLNCLRSFPVIGRVVWGSRTARGADLLADEYKYISVRRTALFIEESLYRGTQWVVFEPNDERTWAAIRMNVGAFMHDLFKQGAFQVKSSKASDSYFVKCDAETTTQNDINRGIVNIWVGFAPLIPAEFVYIYIKQIVNDIQV